MARAQRTLAKEMGDSIDSGETPASFIIPKPYYITSTGEKKDLDWRLSMDGKDISIDFAPEANEHPLAFDPTLSFSAPSQSNMGDVITGEATSSQFGSAMTTGDFNADGRTDLAVGAPNYSTNTGRVYIFYNDGSISSTAATVDIIITGSTGNFGASMATADLNSDGKTDLVVGVYGYSSYTGRAYIFITEAAVKSILDPVHTRGTIKLRGTSKIR